jgi:hypothetical protein
LNVLVGGSDGMSTHAPSASNCQPWYGHRSPQVPSGPFSLRPK